MDSLLPSSPVGLQPSPSQPWPISAPIDSPARTDHNGRMEAETALRFEPVAGEKNRRPLPGLEPP